MGFENGGAGRRYSYADQYHMLHSVQAKAVSCASRLFQRALLSGDSIALVHTSMHSDSNLDMRNVWLMDLRPGFQS